MMQNRFFFDKKRGVSLIVVITITVVAVIIVMAIMPQAVNQRQMVRREANSIRAFYAAESGINKALNDLNDDNWGGWNTTDPDLYTLALQPLDDADGNTVARYKVELKMLDPANPVAVAEGYSPTAADAKKAIVVSFGKSQAAIIAKGDVETRGNAAIIGDVWEYADFSFQNIFGDTIANVKNLHTTEIVGFPANEDNYQPVPTPQDDYVDNNPANGQWDGADDEPLTVDHDEDGIWDDERDITWFVVPEGEKATISATGWTGHNILVVEGDVQISGGTFEGALYVMGDMAFAAGNAQITGVIFVDGDVDDTTEVRGSTTITYDETEIEAAFGGINPMPFEKRSWSEIYN